MKTDPHPFSPFQERLTKESRFVFSCGPHVPCFTECCGKLELLLTPYDVLRLRTGLEMSSEAFLDTHSVIRWRTSHRFPEFLMKMDPESKRCPFVTPQGCSVYAHRPGACRIYPLGRASTINPLDGLKREFYFTVRENHCRGFEETQQWNIGGWISDQGMDEFNRMNDLLMEFYVARNHAQVAEITEQHIQMFVMACYNLEKFRNFVFKSGFLTKFVVEDELVNRLTQDDTAMLEFAFRWLRFALLREPTLEMKAR